MADFSRLTNALKQHALGAVDASNPVNIVFGKVKSVKPFEVDIDQKLQLPEEFFVVGQYVKEYSTDFTIDNETWHGLRKDDELVLACMQGGQKYVIIDFVKRVDEDTRPVQVMTGEVVSTAPNIKINDYLTLTPEQLILCRNVTDFEVDISVSHETEHIHPVIDTYMGGGTSRPTDHLHKYEGKKKITIHNGLVVGDKVLLVCERVTQKWYVVDYVSRMASAVGGEWV